MNDVNSAQASGAFYQDSTQPTFVISTIRPLLVGAVSATTFAGSLMLLNKAWYKHYHRSSFHQFNDSREWLQVDKGGHTWAAYQVARSDAALWQWAGVASQKAVLLGSTSSLAYLTIIEWLDGHSQKWGWSWSDMAANTGGTLLFAAQQLGWGKQRIQIKFSVVPQRYTPELQQRANDLFGRSFPERILKDYNAQTYWLSGNLSSFFPGSHLPFWLNAAVGYGATGLFGGFANRAVDKEGNPLFDRRDIARSRQWYFAPDIDFTRIRTNRKGVRTLLFALNCLKFPTPALEFRNGKLKGRWVQ